MNYSHLFITRVFWEHELTIKFILLLIFGEKSHMLTLFSFISIGIHPKMSSLLVCHRPLFLELLI